MSGGLDPGWQVDADLWQRNDAEGARCSAAKIQK